MSPERHVLVAYATRHGSTREVADAVATQLHELGCRVDLRPADSVETLEGYEGIVLGGAIYTGRVHKAAVRFMERYREELSRLPFAVFAMGPKSLAVAEVASARAQLDKALDRLPELAPAPVAIFGGVVDPSKLHFPFNRLPASDARDWAAIARFAHRAAARFAEQAREVA